jgi:hypothetical protein
MMPPEVSEKQSKLKKGKKQEKVERKDIEK